MRFRDFFLGDNMNDIAVASGTERKEEQKSGFLRHKIPEIFGSLIKSAGNNAQKIAELRMLVCRVSIGETTRSWE